MQHVRMTFLLHFHTRDSIETWTCGCTHITANRIIYCCHSFSKSVLLAQWRELQAKLAGRHTCTCKFHRLFFPNRHVYKQSQQPVSHHSNAQERHKLPRGACAICIHARRGSTYFRLVEKHQKEDIKNMRDKHHKFPLRQWQTCMHSFESLTHVLSAYCMLQKSAMYLGNCLQMRRTSVRTHDSCI